MGALDTTGKLVQGTCGWGSPHQHLSVYPSSCRSAEDRLEVYCKHFGCVEVDSTCYAIPSPESVKRWIRRTSGAPGFEFIVKAFGAFCASSVDVASLPRGTREILGLSPDSDATRPGPRRARYDDMPEPAKAHLWSRFHAALEPLLAERKLACVLFQFHLSFPPGPASRAKVEALRRRLDPRARMAVEFRAREWIVGDVGDATAEWCRSLDLALVAADELRHETAQPDRDQRGLPPGETREVLPTRLDATASWGAVARVHRRHGTSERILSGEEIKFWGERVRAVAPKLRGKGPVWVAWGTDWGDAPLVNAAALATAAGENVALDWAAAQRKRAAKTGVAGLFAKAAEAKAKAEAKTEAEVKAEAKAKAGAVETAAETAPVASRVGGGGGDAGGTSGIGSSRSRVVTLVGNGDEDGDATRGNAASGRKRDAGCWASGAPPAKRAESSTIARMFAKHTS